MTEQLLDVKDVTEKTTLSRARIYEMVSEGIFPEPLRLGAQTVRWREAEIDQWIRQLPRARSGQSEALER